MTVTSPTPAPETPTELQDAAPAEATTAGAAAAAEPSDASQAGGAPKWLPIVTSVLCIGLMALVLVLATSEGEDGPPRPPSSGSTLGPHTGPGARGEVGPAMPSPSRTLAACGELDPTTPPRIELGFEGDVDFGDLKQGVQLVREVTFRSTGTGPLCVIGAKSTCGCLKASLQGAKHLFAPGETGTVRLAVDTSGRSGVINKRVTITSNDPKNPLISFRVMMDISDGLMSDPRYLQFGNVPPGTSTSRSVYLRTKPEDKDWKVTGVESIRRVTGMKPVKYTFEVEELKDPKYRRLKVRVLHPGMDTLGAFQDRLVIHTTHPERPRVELPAHIHIVPRIIVRARTVSLGFVRAGTPRAPTRARIAAGAPGIVFALESVEVLPPEGASFGPGGAPFVAKLGKDSRGWWVDVKYDGKARAAGLIKARLRIKTDDPQQPELLVPVRATLQAAK